jgi:hypothetical protein
MSTPESPTPESSTPESSTPESDELDTDPPVGHRDRHEHGGAADRPDVDALAQRTETERAEAGLIDYDPADVPPATDADTDFDPTQTEEFEEEVGEVKRQAAAGELYPITDENPFPRTRYDE